MINKLFSVVRRDCFVVIIIAGTTHGPRRHGEITRRDESTGVLSPRLRKTLSFPDASRPASEFLSGNSYENVKKRRGRVCKMTDRRPIQIQKYSGAESRFPDGLISDRGA